MTDLLNKQKFMQDYKLILYDNIFGLIYSTNQQFVTDLTRGLLYIFFPF